LICLEIWKLFGDHRLLQISGHEQDLQYSRQTLVAKLICRAAGKPFFETKQTRREFQTPFKQSKMPGLSSFRNFSRETGEELLEKILPAA